MITDKKNGIVVKRTSKDIYLGVKYLLDNSSECIRIAQNAVNGGSSNQKIMQEIENCFEQC